MLSFGLAIKLGVESAKLDSEYMDRVMEICYLKFKYAADEIPCVKAFEQANVPDRAKREFLRLYGEAVLPYERINPNWKEKPVSRNRL